MALRARGCRGRSGPVMVTFLAESTGAPRVGFAIPKAVGPAVARNRLRRRGRAVLGDPSAQLRPGAYLLRLSPAAADLDFGAFRGAVTAAVDAAHYRADAVSGDVRA